MYLLSNLQRQHRWQATEPNHVVDEQAGGNATNELVGDGSYLAAATS
jgi:hypothetical protein